MKPEDQVYHGERGASLVEYVILVALISITCIIAIQALSLAITRSVSESTDEIAGAGTVIE